MFTLVNLVIRGMMLQSDADALWDKIVEGLEALGYRPDDFSINFTSTTKEGSPPHAKTEVLPDKG